MSTTSSTTASGRDWVLYNESESNLQTQMCVITLTKRDGTPFDWCHFHPGRGHHENLCLVGTHPPLGVLHYPAMESIVLFRSADDMEHAICRAIKTMVLCDEPIAVGATALLKPTWGPTWLQWGEEPHSPTGNPHLGGELCTVSKWSLVTSLITNWISSWRISVGRLHSMNWMHPPEALNQTLG